MKDDIMLGDDNKKIIHNNIIVSFGSFILWFFFPILSIPIFLFLLGYNQITLTKTNQFLLIILIACSFGLISYVTGSGGAEDNDMVRYRQVFGLMTDRQIEELNVGSYFFLIINWFIANYISPDGQVMSFVFTSISYFFILLSIKRFSILYVEKKYHCLVLFSVIFIISILVTTEFVKQVLSSALFLFGLTYKITSKKRSYIWLVLSVLVHPASAIMIAPLYFYDFRIVRKNIYLILVICIILSQIDIVQILASFSNLPIMETLGFSDRLQAYSSDYEGFGGSKRYYLIFLFYILQIFPIYYAFFKRKDTKNPICVFFLLTVCILLFNMSNTHNFARLTRNFYPFQILALIFSIQYINFPFKKIWIYLIMACLFGSNMIEFTRTMVNVNYHATFMGNDWLALFFSNVLNFINYKV
ncbi:EpsG family protein [Dysgonomonas sp. GY617]|nr:EpsG family protein [Dysgonomonas sp. GY617]